MMVVNIEMAIVDGCLSMRSLSSTNVSYEMIYVDSYMYWPMSGAGCSSMRRVTTCRESRNGREYAQQPVYEEI